MANSKDATTLLIQRMLSQVNAKPNYAQSYDTNSNAISQLTTVVGYVANYQQILGTVAAPIVQEVQDALKQIADLQQKGQVIAGIAPQAAALSAAAITGIGAALVFVASALLAAVSAAGGSSESQILGQLGEAINNLTKDFIDVGLGSHWQDNLSTLQSYWNSPGGAIGDDLDNLRNEGTGGPDVQTDVSHFHDHALAFVNNLVPSKSPLGIASLIYWQRPVLAKDTFTAQKTVYGSYDTQASAGWYGQLPQPQVGTPLQGAEMVKDPRTMLPFLVLGLQSYLMIQALLNFIDPTQPTFDWFVKTFSGDLKDYADFLEEQYKLAVNGIVKSDLPSTPDFTGFVNGFIPGLQFPGASGFPPPVAGSDPEYPYPTPTVGDIWNGVYGSIDTYPLYGYYYPELPVPVPGAAPSYVIDNFFYGKNDPVKGAIYRNLLADWQQANIINYDYLRNAVFADWVLPWLQNNVLLGRMGRWKALYLLNGYDQVWSMIQTLRFLINPDPRLLLATIQLDQDHTIANGDWSVIELCKTLNFGGDILGGITVPLHDDSVVTEWSSALYPPPGGGGMPGYSVFALVGVLDNIARGNYAGLEGTVGGWVPPGTSPKRPLSFRDRLAAIAFCEQPAL